MEKIAASPDFYYLGSCFIRDDAPPGRDNFSDWAKQAIALTHLPPDKIGSLKAFLDQILSSPNDSYIDSMWNEMGVSSIHVSGGGNSSGMTREWFKTIRELLDTIQVKSLEGKS